jgi:hypothetical protein
LSLSLMPARGASWRMNYGTQRTSWSELQQKLHPKAAWQQELHLPADAGVPQQQQQQQVTSCLSRVLRMHKSGRASAIASCQLPGSNCLVTKAAHLQTTTHLSWVCQVARLRPHQTSSAAATAAQCTHAAASLAAE